MTNCTTGVAIYANLAIDLHHMMIETLAQQDIDWIQNCFTSHMRFLLLVKCTRFINRRIAKAMPALSSVSKLLSNVLVFVENL